MKHLAYLKLSEKCSAISSNDGQILQLANIFCVALLAE